MKRSFLVLILMFIASPPAFAEQDSCPCFNDLQIAGTCSRAPRTYLDTTSEGAVFVCDVYTGSDPPTQWIYRAEADTQPSCNVTVYLTEGQRRRGYDGAIDVVTNSTTPEQLADCVGQIISAAEMLN